MQECNYQWEAHHLNQTWLADSFKNKKIKNSFARCFFWNGRNFPLMRQVFHTCPQAGLLIPSVISASLIWVGTSWLLISFSRSRGVKLNFYISWVPRCGFIPTNKGGLIKHPPPSFPHICGWALFRAHSSILCLDIPLKGSLGSRCEPLNAGSGTSVSAGPQAVTQRAATAWLKTLHWLIPIGVNYSCESHLRLISPCKCALYFRNISPCWRGQLLSLAWLHVFRNALRISHFTSCTFTFHRYRWMQVSMTKTTPASIHQKTSVWVWTSS